MENGRIRSKVWYFLKIELYQGLNWTELIRIVRRGLQRKVTTRKRRKKIGLIVQKRSAKFEGKYQEFWAILLNNLQELRSKPRTVHIFMRN